MQLTNTTGRLINFGAGPAAVPFCVLEQFCRDLMNFESTGVGVAELSHRGEAFEKGILGKAKERFFQLCGYDEGQWSLLWMTGGGTGQFSAIPMNYLPETRESDCKAKAIYLISGTWSEKAAGEAELLRPGCVLKIDLRCRNGKGEISLLSQAEISEKIAEFRQNNSIIAYLYACDNETVDGLEFPSSDWITECSQGIPIILDCSSNFLSRPLPRADSSIELIFAGVQKNLGGAGVTAVLKRKSTSFSHSHSRIPAVMDYVVMEKHDSLLNTPPVMNIHLCSLMLEWLLNKFPGGLSEIDEFSKRKAKALYDCLSTSRAFYCDIDLHFQSRMNVVFHGKEATQEKELLKRTEAAGMIQLKGHRSVGGLRASLYNSIEESSVSKLIQLIKQE